MVEVVPCMEFEYYKSDVDQPHPARTRALLAAHPEVRQLMGRNIYTALIALFIVVLQTTIAFWMGRLGMHYWWFSLLIALCVGAFANHACYVIIHDATHNLVFQGKNWNRWLAILADLPNIGPGAMGFRVYHLKHHAHQGAYELDVDLPNHWEARIVGNVWYRKAIWLMLFPLLQLTRPPRVKTYTMWSRWLFLNLACSLAYDVAITYFFGGGALLYLAFSFFFSIGLHPLGARWIQEHFTLNFPQETFSYYGPINLVALNVGYHNEHHDFPSIPWNNLPKLRAMAPEFYDTLKWHPSWSGLLFQFIFDKRYSVARRVEREKESAPEFNPAAQTA